MDVQEVLRFADEMVFAKTGEHLDDLQKAILLGVWEGQKYSQIAETSYCSEGHIRNIASKLWKRLSNVLDEDVTQSNLRSTLERRQLFIVSQNFGNDFVIGNVNVCKDTQSPEVPKARSPSTPGLFHSQINHRFVGVVPPCLPSSSTILYVFQRLGRARGHRPYKRMKQPCPQPQTHPNPKPD